MFGYIVINQSEMKFKEYDVYRSYYCGLCQSLKERYGVLGQLSLNYDMTFILMLLTGLYEPEEQEAQCRCVAHPLEKHPTRRNLFTDYVADMTVLFSCYKAEDDWEDEHSLKGLVYSYLLGRKFRKKPLLYQEKVRNISLAMQDFADAESRAMRILIPWRDCLAESWHRLYPVVRMSGRIIWRDLDFSWENSFICWMPMRISSRISKKEPIIR